MRAALFLLLTAGCRQLLGFESPTVAGSDGPPVDTGDAARCTAADPACSGTTPVCSDQQCRGCRSHDECESQACMPDGSCASEDEVAYASAAGSGVGCTKAFPCKLVSEAMVTDHRIIKISGTISELIQIAIDSTSYVFLSEPGAVLTRSGGNGGPIVRIKGQETSVSIVGLTITNTTNGIAGIEVDGGTLILDRVKVIDCQGRGLDAQNALELDISRSIFTGNVLGGAVLVDSKFAISNSLFVLNGSPTSSVGGFRTTNTAASSTFELNTVAANLTNSANAGSSGVSCAEPFSANSNIVAGFNGVTALAGACTFDHSLFTGVSPAGVGNQVTDDPRFQNTNSNDPSANDFFRLAADSPAIDQGVSTIAIDIDGQPRPVGAAPDMGADERQ